MFVVGLFGWRVGRDAGGLGGEVNVELDICEFFRASVTDMDGVHAFPSFTGSMDREPRSCHKVDALTSYTGPQVVKPDAFDSTAKRRRLDARGFISVKVEVFAKDNAFRCHPHASDPFAVHDAQRDVRMALLELATKKEVMSEWERALFFFEPSPCLRAIKEQGFQGDMFCGGRLLCILL